MALPVKSAVRVNQIVSMLFAIGLGFFPQPFLDGYKAIEFEGEAKVMVFFAFGLCGCQMLQSGLVSAQFRTEAASEKAAGVLTLFNALYWLFFAVSDGSMVVLGTLPPNFPKDSIAGNCFLFLIMASVNFNAWVGAGSPKPDFGKMKPGGPLATPLMVMMFNLLGFGVGCAFFTEQFVDQFNPGLLSKFNPGARGAIILMVGNAGKMMLFNILIACAVGAAEFQSADTNYRLLRAWVYGMFFYMGRFADEAVTAGTYKISQIPTLHAHTRLTLFVYNQRARAGRRQCESPRSSPASPRCSSPRLCWGTTRLPSPRRRKRDYRKGKVWVTRTLSRFG